MNLKKAMLDIEHEQTTDQRIAYLKEQLFELDELKVVNESMVKRTLDLIDRMNKRQNAITAEIIILLEKRAYGR